MRLEVVRDLRLAAPGTPHVAAASGVAVAGERVHVIADDELHLAVFSLDDAVPGRLERVLPGELPAGPGPRKAAKPDLEGLCVLPEGALLAVGSGSTPRRERGVRLPLGADGTPAGAPEELDLGPLYAELRARLGTELNVEGVAPAGDRLVLAQRGDARGRGNALVVLDALAPAAIREIVPVSLGAVHGVHLALSDVAAAPGGGLLFTAVAEDAPNAYEDGPFAGAAVGALALDGTVLWSEPVDPPVKVEGIDALGPGEALLVDDDDDRATPGRLLRARLPA